MSSSRELRSRSTTIYVVISILLVALGIAATLWGGASVPDEVIGSTLFVQRSVVMFSLGTSLLAAGLVSLGFAVTRHYDDKDSTKIQDGLTRYESLLLTFKDSLDSVETVSRGAAKRCVFESAISPVFRKALEAGCRRDAASVDVVGLKLSRFLIEQLDYLKQYSITHPVQVRMLLQEPDTSEFKLLCQLESKNEVEVKKDIAKSLRMLTNLDNSGSALNFRFGGLAISVKFYSGFQPVAFFRVNDTVSVRPRIRAQGAGTLFYETYKQSEGREYYGLFTNHFDNCWDESKARVPDSIEVLLERVRDENAGMV